MLTLGGCLLADKPEPALDIPQSYDGSSRNPAIAEARAATARLVARLSLARTDRDHREGARGQSRYRRGDRAHRAGRRAGAHRRLLAAAEFRARMPARPLARLAKQRHRLGRPVGTRHALPPPSSASYEIDFWGKNRSALRAAEQTAVASRYDREVVGLSTVVTAANAYFQVLAAQDRLAGRARERRPAPTRVLDLITQRVNAGTASALDTAQQESLVNSQRAAIPPLEQTLKQNRNALAVLMARSPESVRVRGGTLRSIALSARDAGPAVRTADAAPRHSRSRSATCRRQCQCRKRARADAAVDHADRRRRLSERRAENLAAAGIGAVFVSAPV